MAGLGELMVKIGADISNFTKGMNQVDNKMKGSSSAMAGNMKGSGNSVMGTLGNIGKGFTKVAGLAGIAATAMGIVGKPLVEQAASAQAMEAQFTQTFGEMEGTAQKSVEKIGKEVGMLPNRIKPQFAQFTSMFKGLGFTTEDAMGMSERAMMSAADASAFYDVSMEDASSSLNSFLKGNYEAGEGIGLFASETQMANYASDKLGLSWDELSEGQKQLVRIDYIESMQKASGAMNQASRESDSYQNKVGNLKSAWEGLMAKMGEPLLDPVIASLQWLTDLITSIDFGAIGDKFTAMATKFNEATGFMETGGAVYEKIAEIVKQAVGGIVDFVKSKLDLLKQFWSENGSQIMEAVGNVWTGIKAVFDFVLPAILAVVKFVWDSIKGVISGALDIIMGAVKIFSGLFTGDFSKMWEGVKQLFSGAIEFVWNLMNLYFIGAIRKGIVTFVKNIGTKIKGLWDTIKLHFMYGKDKVVALMNTFKGMIGKIWDGLKSAVVNVAKSLWTSVKNGFNSLKNSVVSIFNGLKSSATSVWNAIKNAVSSAVTSLKSKASSTISSMKDGIVKSFNTVKDKAVSIFNGVKDAITKPIQSAKDTVMGIIDKIKSGFSNMKISIPKFKLPSVSVGSKSFLDGKVKVPTFKVNWNAKGAIFNQATVLGGGQGVGEAGAEAVIPIQHKRYMAPFARAVAEQLPQNQIAQAGGGVYEINIPLEIDGKEFARATAKFTDEQLEKFKKRKSRLEGDI